MPAKRTWIAGADGRTARARCADGARTIASSAFGLSRPMRSIWPMTGRERRMMHHDDRGSIGRLVEAVLEPRKALRVEGAPARAGDHRVERDEAHRPGVDRVLDERVRLAQVRMVGERVPQRVALVVIAGQQVDRHRQRREQVAQMRVRLGPAGVGEVAGDHDDVGPLRQAPGCASTQRAGTPRCRPRGRPARPGP